MLLRKLLINRPMALLWLGQVISKAGDVTYQIGLMWLMLELTGSKSLTGFVAAAGYLPALLIGLWAGVMADRLPRVRMMLAADGVRAALVLGVPLLYLAGLANSVTLGLITFLVATAATFFNPARDAFIPHVVRPEELFHANSLIQTSWQVAALLGPLLAGVVLKLFGLLNLFTLDALTFALSFVAVLYLLPFEPKREAAPAREGFKASLGPLLEGLRYAFSDKTLLWLLIITATDNLVLMGAAMIGTPIFVRDVLNLGPSAYAIIEAGYAGGIIIGAPLVAWLGRRYPKGRIILFGMIMDGLTFVPLLWVRTLHWAVATIVFHSIFIPMITVTRATMVQSIVPKEMTARVFSMIEVAVIGFTALSVALTGIWADFTPITTIYAAIGFLAAGVGAFGLFVGGLKDAL